MKNLFINILLWITQLTHIECITSITQHGLVALYWQTPVKKCKNRQKLPGKSVNP